MKGQIENNSSKYGNEYDAYINRKSIDGVDDVYNEYIINGVEIISKPSIKDYGSYEFVFKDIDGRIVGIGLIKSKDVYFEDSNHL